MWWLVDACGYRGFSDVATLSTDLSALSVLFLEIRVEPVTRLPNLMGILMSGSH